MGRYPPSEMHLRRSRQVARGRRPSHEGGASGCASPRSGCPSRGGKRSGRGREDEKDGKARGEARERREQNAVNCKSSESIF